LTRGRGQKFHTIGYREFGSNVPLEKLGVPELCFGVGGRNGKKIFGILRGLGMRGCGENIGGRHGAGFKKLLNNNYRGGIEMGKACGG